MHLKPCKYFTLAHYRKTVLKTAMLSLLEFHHTPENNSFVSGEKDTLRFKDILGGMAHLKMEPYSQIVSLPAGDKNLTKLPSLGLRGQHTSKPLSKLELMKNNLQQKQFEEKEQKLIAMYNQQQQAALWKVRNTFQPQTHSAAHRGVSNQPGATQHRGSNSAGARYNPSNLFEQEPASTAPSKKTAGVDRAYLLKSVYYRKAVSLNDVFRAGDTKSQKPMEPTRSSPFKPSPPADARVRSNPRTGRYSESHNLEYMTPPPATVNQSRGRTTRSKTGGQLRLQGEKSSPDKEEWYLQEEIRKREALLREKLRRTEEELRRIQRERELGEERKEKGKQGQRGRAQVKYRSAYSTGDESSSSSDSALRGPYRVSKGSDDIAHVSYLVENNSHMRPHSHSNESRSEKLKRVSSNYILREINESPNCYNTYDKQKNKHFLTEENVSYHNMSVSETSFANHTGNFKEEPPAENADLATCSGRHSKLYEEQQNEDGKHDASFQLVVCTSCNRKFAADRLERHSKICEKVQNSTRKVFDSTKHRAKGTDLEQYINRRSKNTSPQPKKNSWRHKHETFIRNIQQARLVQEVIAKGGKASDLPPPLPDENPDYVSCPHCARRFAPRVAERHISKCENIKSRPPPPRKK
ncbi:zinc finger C2HC domain-containing protein 1C-like [Polyodon spathula]|uniref:zinc finger C2HC domain-containing protein 1C-like n=1 Tax=Polyodon spathula TaxID=7913 RepID=UPI001B7EB217|nr:zinc finger C2HC domain-containing protein 1C-like [Polyodon spathula]